MTVQHILVPTDFSQYADYALDYAIELAKVLQAHLTVLHVFHLSPLALGEAPPAVLADTLAAMEANAQHQTQMALARVQEAGLQGDSAIVEGIPFQVIINTAESMDVDLIVMGTHGRTGLTPCPHGQRGGKSGASGPLSSPGDAGNNRSLYRINPTPDRPSQSKMHCPVSLPHDVQDAQQMPLSYQG